MRAVWVALLLIGCGDDGRAGLCPTSPHAAQGRAPVPGLRRSCNQIVDGDGRPVRLLGVNRSGTEYACIQGYGIFDGPSDDTSLDSIRTWKANAVRVPMN